MAEGNDCSTAPCKSGAPELSVASSAAAWTLNVVSSVGLVLANKLVMAGCGFRFAVTLCVLHLFTCAAWFGTLQVVSKKSSTYLPVADLVMFTIVSSVSVASLNISLLVNSVGFYQTSKLAVIPFICVTEYFLFNRTMSIRVICSIIVVLFGLAIITVSDIRVNMSGLVVSVVSIVSSGTHQILCGFLQRKHSISSSHMLLQTSFYQGLALLSCAPFLDKMISSEWVFSYSLSWWSLFAIALSCSLAVLANYSGFQCLGRFSAGTFQIMGHCKTLLILLLGSLLFEEPVTMKQACGMCIVVFGLAAYSYYAHLDTFDAAPHVSYNNQQHEKTVINHSQG